MTHPTYDRLTTLVAQLLKEARITASWAYHSEGINCGALAAAIDAVQAELDVVKPDALSGWDEYDRRVISDEWGEP